MRSGRVWHANGRRVPDIGTQVYFLTSAASAGFALDCADSEIRVVFCQPSMENTPQYTLCYIRNARHMEKHGETAQGRTDGRERGNFCKKYGQAHSSKI